MPSSIYNLIWINLNNSCQARLKWSKMATMALDGSNGVREKEKEKDCIFQQEQKLSQQNYSANCQKMQFQNNWDSTFDKIVQGVTSGKEGLCQSQINSQARAQSRGIGVVRQQNRTYRGEELVRMLENYEPISQLIDWQELRQSENTQLKKYRESVYFGSIIDGNRSGIGIMLYTNGRVYEGNWHNNFKHQKGLEKFQNGAIYNGTYAKGKPEGYGTYSYDNGETFEGEWVDGQKHGSGIWRGPQGDSYIGEWKQGQAFGYGVHTWINGDRYEGEFQNCLKHGEGVQKFANGDSYKGLYSNGKPEGYGQYYWAIGSFFKGNFKNGMRDGKGVWKRGPGNSDKYEGQYKQDKKEGYGIFVWENGNIYKGNFVNDLREGYGQMYFTNGTCFKGEWEQGQQISGELQAYPESKVQNEADEWCTHVQRRNASQGTTRSRNKIDYRPMQRRVSQDQVLEIPNDSFFEEQPAFHYSQPNHPSLIEAQKRFRARGVNSKKCSRPVLESQKTTRSFLSSNSTGNNKMFMRNNQGESAQKKVRQGQSDSKMMSSNFFLYKIHGQNADTSGSIRTRPRAVKTSGGMRQKQISQQIKYFTRNKINPEFV